MPKVSVIIPTYNYEAFIGDAITSVLSQTLKDYEIIVIDDGSTDNTLNVLNKYESDIKLISKNNGGPSSARNAGINASSGIYISFLDADDFYMPSKLQTQTEILDLNKNLHLSYSDFYCVNHDLSLVTKYYKSKSFSTQSSVMTYLAFDNFINTSTVMMTRESIDNIGGFNEEYKYLEDYDLWIRAGSRYNFSYISKALVKTRSHFNNYRYSVIPEEKVSCYNSIRKNLLNKF